MTTTAVVGGSKPNGRELDVAVLDLVDGLATARSVGTLRRPAASGSVRRPMAHRERALRDSAARRPVGRSGRGPSARWTITRRRGSIASRPGRAGRSTRLSPSGGCWIRGARFVSFPGIDHFFWAGNQDELLDEIERFVASVRDEEAELDRVLATVMFTDIVGSTARAAELGDRGWCDVVERHHGIVRALLGRFRGKEVDTAGDGFFATFDGPARAVRFAQAIGQAVQGLGLEVRAGVHTGEVETIAGKVGGIAVNVGARVAALAGPSEVLVSSTVKDLVSGSGLAFENAGEHE